MKHVATAILSLGLLFLCACRTTTFIPDKTLVKCAGQITNFKNGAVWIEFADGEVAFDVTEIKIAAPVQYAGRTLRVLSRSLTPGDPLRVVGKNRVFVTRRRFFRPTVGKRAELASERDIIFLEEHRVFVIPEGKALGSPLGIKSR